MSMYYHYGLHNTETREEDDSSNVGSDNASEMSVFIIIGTCANKCSSNAINGNAKVLYVCSHRRKNE